MQVIGGGAHILVFPYPAQGHMIPLLDLTHHLATLGLTITVLVTPKNLSLLNPLLSKHPSSIKTLVLPFPTHPSLPAGVENAKDLTPKSAPAMMRALGELRQPLLQWFNSHPSPPIAIVSDMFLGWTHRLACQLGILRVVFSPSGAMALSVMYYLWRDLPKRNDPDDHNALISFPKMPNSPIYPWYQLSGLYRSYIEGDPVSEFIKDGFRANMASWGLVLNSFESLEKDYLDYLTNELGHDRVWTVGPLLDPSGPTERGGPGSNWAGDIMAWLDSCKDHTVVYVCFGSQAVLTSEQMEALGLGLEKSGAKFIWCIKEARGDAKCGVVPPGLEDRVAGRGRIVRGWAPQVSILSHRAVGAFLTHCGWNSVLEGLVAGVAMLAWPMGADQFVNATLLVEELKVAIRVCEGAESVPNSDELGQLVAQLVVDGNRVEMVRAMESSKAALDAIKGGGSSFKDLDRLVMHLTKEASLRDKILDVEQKCSTMEFTDNHYNPIMHA